ncbi:hypothetical protein [Tautonia plasticadhaerens]|uniref:hypothetical protein n=1 Tax=Tautonia plasticadhaerens TaxID=2527974 RepID=UPI00119DD6B6|nr:hypothetical protein [Tautonia plasticadhaerens]
MRRAVAEMRLELDSLIGLELGRLLGGSPGRAAPAPAESPPPPPPGRAANSDASTAARSGPSPAMVPVPIPIPGPAPESMPPSIAVASGPEGRAADRDPAPPPSRSLPRDEPARGRPGALDDDGDDDPGRRLDALARRLEGRLRRARDRPGGRPRPEDSGDRPGAADPGRDR